MITLIRLRKATIEDKEELLAFKEEFKVYNEKTIPGSELLDKMDNYDDWLKYITKNCSKETVSEDWVLTDTFIAFDESDEIIGIIALRHDLNDFLKDYGHIGYSVRPSKRNKGYATSILRKILQKAKNSDMNKVYISTKEDNLASRRCIQNNGGHILRSFVELDEKFLVYEINL